MKRIHHVKISAFFIVLLLLLQTIVPMKALGESINIGSNQLYQFTQTMILNESITIQENTFIYGEKVGDAVEIQYADTHITIPLNNLQEVQLTESAPEFIDSEQIEGQVDSLKLSKDTALYSINPDEMKRILITEEIEYPTSQKAEGIGVVYLGNVEFYLSKEDRQVVAKGSANENTEPNTEVSKEPPKDSTSDEEKNKEEVNNDKKETEETPIENNDQQPQEPLSNNNDEVTNKDIEKAEEDKHTSLIEDEKIPSKDNKEDNIQEKQFTAFSAKSEKTSEKTLANTDSWEGVSASYFKVVEEKVTVYSKGKTKKLGELKKGQVYPIDSDYGNWHQIQFGMSVGYVLKQRTIPDDGTNLQNENASYTHSKRTFVTSQETPVYDNSTGKLVEFGIIQENEEYPIVSDYGNNWLRVVFTDRVGYVLKSQVRQTFDGGERYFRVLTSNLPVYDNRSGSLKEVGTLTKGQTYERVSDYGNWHRIKFNNHYGYVYKGNTEPSSGNRIKNNNTSYNHTNRSFTTLKDVIVYDNSSGKLKAFGTIEEGQSYYIASNYGNWWRIVFANRVGYVHKNDVKYNFVDSDNYFKVLIDNLAVYTNKGSGLVKVGELKKGQVYPRVSEYGNWHKVKFGNDYGYVYAEGTEVGNKNNVSNLNKDYSHSGSKIVITENVTVYDNSTGKLVPFGELEKGTIYPIATEYGENWWRIVYLNRVGYVLKSHVESGLSVNVPKLQVYESYNDLAYYTRQDEIYTLYYGDKVQILEEYNYAAKIKINKNGIVGWVHKDKLDENLLDNWWYVKDARNLREDATSNSSDIGGIEGGTSVKVLDYVYLPNQKYSDWFRVQTSSGVTGWIWGGSVNGYNVMQYEKEYYNGTVNHINLFTPLNSKSTLTEDQINRFIASKVGASSYMYGMGDAFLEAQNVTGVNAMYLVSHAAHETNYGTSDIVKAKYNYFGISAFDACPNECADSFEGKRAGIIGGAQWISDYYIHRDAYQQFTLYNMRYNNNTHQYATDEAWDAKIVDITRNLINYLGF
ncbi:SH3 domain-containing protein [Virgibacillus ndiopensis]|uniref:SH3 domain-containing protein n=1 Tax=Virgibacillus ndiopensis TaxID=2004408 RepID=UPI000C06C27A|nr:SH3 domain-containing protein [Virgibacillus ndiopensis]